MERTLICKKSFIELPIHSLVGTIVLMFIFLFLPSQAMGQNKKKHKLKQFVERADSLRLRLRDAADHGRMLQWGDSLLRARLKKGEINENKFEKLQRRLRRYDSLLFRGDTLLASTNRKKNIDTAYIIRPDARWTIKLRGNLSSASLNTIANENDGRHDTKLQAEFRGTLSVSVLYRGIGAALAVNPAKWAGKSKDFEFNLNSYSNRYGFDVVYLSSSTYHGTRTTSGEEKITIDKGLVNQKALNVNAYYAFNYRRFSYPAAFSQSYIQRHSAGSWMIGASFDGTRTNINADENKNIKQTKIHTSEFAIGAGYGYNLVASKHWLFHLSALPTVTVYSHDNITIEGERTNMKYHFPSAILTGRGAAVYSWRNKFAGLTMVYNFSVTGNDTSLEIRRHKWRARMFFGFRF